MDSRTVRVMMPIEGETALYHCGAVEHEGEFWLVPNWIPFPSEGYAMPERMIQLKRFQHQLHESPNGDLDAMIGSPIPRALIDGPLSPELIARFGVLVRPEIKFRTGGIRH